MKKCSYCGTEKPLDQFYKDARYSQGVHGHCIACKKSYERSYRERAANREKPQLTAKRCYTCNKEKPISEFGRCKTKSDGYYSRCKACRELIEAPRRRARRTGHKNHLWSHFRMRQVDYNELFDAQDGKCAICGDGKLRLNIDHCHVSGIVRGLICYRCNTFLSRLEHGQLMSKTNEYILRAKSHPLPFTRTEYRTRQDERKSAAT